MESLDILLMHCSGPGGAAITARRAPGRAGDSGLSLPPGIRCSIVRAPTEDDIMTVPAPLELYQESVQPDWIDYNGHMNVAYYVLAFDHACDAFLDYIGMDEAYRARTGGTTFAVEAHVTYQNELAEGNLMRFTTQLLGYDEKRIHYILKMYHAEEGYVAATTEWLSVHVDLEARRVVPMPEEITSRLAAIHATHQELPWPSEAGRAVSLSRNVK